MFPLTPKLDEDTMPREDNSEERKNRILEAALNVFARRGFDEARMEDIATESGVSKGGLYLYYKSKDAIIEALLRTMFASEFGGLQALLHKPGSARERILSLTHIFVNMVDRLSVAMPVMLEFYAIAARRQSVRDFMSQAFRDYRELFAELFRQGIASGEFRETDPDKAAVALIALYEGMALIWVMDPHAFSWRTYGEQTVTYLLDGLRP